jgi:hypothetical protein
MPYDIRFELDPNPFARGGSVAIFCVSLMHILQAMLIFDSNYTLNATGIKALNIVFDKLDFDINYLAGLMIFTAILALFGTLMRLGWVRLAIFIPQHFILGVSALGGAFATINGAYLDGTVIAWQHIMADQTPAAMLFAVHSSAILRRARDPNG